MGPPRSAAGARQAAQARRPRCAVLEMQGACSGHTGSRCWAQRSAARLRRARRVQRAGQEAGGHAAEARRGIKQMRAARGTGALQGRCTEGRQPTHVSKLAGAGRALADWQHGLGEREHRRQHHEQPHIHRQRHVVHRAAPPAGLRVWYTLCRLATTRHAPSVRTHRAARVPQARAPTSAPIVLSTHVRRARASRAGHVGGAPSGQERDVCQAARSATCGCAGRCATSQAGWAQGDTSLLRHPALTPQQRVQGTNGEMAPLG